MCSTLRTKRGRREVDRKEVRLVLKLDALCVLQPRACISSPDAVSLRPAGDQLHQIVANNATLNATLNATAVNASSEAQDSKGCDSNSRCVHPRVHTRSDTVSQNLVAFDLAKTTQYAP